MRNPTLYILLLFILAWRDPSVAQQITRRSFLIGTAASIAVPQSLKIEALSSPTVAPVVQQFQIIQDSIHSTDEMSFRENLAWGESFVKDQMGRNTFYSAERFTFYEELVSRPSGGPHVSASPTETALNHSNELVETSRDCVSNLSDTPENVEALERAVPAPLEPLSFEDRPAAGMPMIQENEGVLVERPSR